jgi:Glycosyltransferase
VNPKILQISAGVTHGGAARIARGLHESLKKHGFISNIATGGFIPQGEDFLPIPKNTFSHPKNTIESILFHACRNLTPYIGRIKGAGFLRNLLYNLAKPSCLIKNIRGVENFENYPGTKDFFDSLTPDIIHCHNLHGKYFDLTILPSLKMKVVLTLHDEWMFTGHCAGTLGCEKWQTGCGNCPHLKIYPPLWRDTSAYNLKQKENIYKQCRLHIVTPSQWLMNRVEKSVLQPASKTVIHNGVDLTIFKPGNKAHARKLTNLPQDAHIILSAAYNLTSNPFKDFATLEKAFFLLAEQQPIILVCLGHTQAPIIKNNSSIIFLDYVHDMEKLAQYYQAADLFIHATKADNFPTTVLESLACGTPVIGTNIGGIPEQITTATGMLYTLGDAQELAEKISFYSTTNRSANTCHNKQFKMHKNALIFKNN